MDDVESQTAQPAAPHFEGWGVIELFGHRKRAGRISVQDVAGVQFVRLDVPLPGGDEVAFYSPKAVYGIHPCSEKVARQAAEAFYKPPVESWELPHVPQLTSGKDHDTDPDELDSSPDYEIVYVPRSERPSGAPGYEPEPEE